MAPRAKSVALPVWEQIFYWVCGTTGTAYILYKVYAFSSALKSKTSMDLPNLKDGWTIFGGKKDEADDEWALYASELVWQYLSWFLVHFALSVTMQFFNIDVTTKKLLFISCGAAATCHTLSARYLLLMILTPLVFHWVSTQRSVPAVWLTAAVCIQALNFSFTRFVHYLNLTTLLEEEIFLTEWSSALTRSAAYALERVWVLNQLEQQASNYAKACRLSSKDEGKDDDHGSGKSAQSGYEFTEKNCGKDQNPEKTGVLYGWSVMPKVPGITDGLLFVFYIPAIFSGGLLCFNKFCMEMENPKPLTRERLSDIVWCLVRIVFWFVFNQVLLHFVFFTALALSPMHLEQMDRPTVFGIAFWLGQFMTNKYFVVYGLPHQISRFDGLDPPDFPACISYIFKYSDMWKSFDRGLYEYMKRYIYIPCGGSRSGSLRHLVATLMTFTFMGYWHGAKTEHVWWVVLNFLEVEAEIAGGLLARSSFVQAHLLQNISAQGYARLTAALTVPVFVIGTTSNMFFLGGTNFGIFYAKTVLTQGLLWIPSTFTIYCMIHNVRHLERLGYTKY